MENLKLILAAVLLVAYAAKRVWQKVAAQANKTEAKPWYKESETLTLIIAEVILLAESVQGLFS